MQKILVIEDNFLDFREIAAGLEGKIEILRAQTIEDGRRLFQENPDVALIVIDACMPCKLDTLPLLKEIVASGYGGPIIASSSRWDFRRIQLENGATHEAYKSSVGEKVLALLHLS